MPEPIDLHPENLGHANWQQLDQKSMPVLSVKQIRALEQAAFAHIDSFLLMAISVFLHFSRKFQKKSGADMFAAVIICVYN